MSLRVLHIDTGQAWRGGQRQVYLLARAQRHRGEEPLVIAHPDAPLIRRLRAHGLAAAAVRARADWDLTAMRRVRSLVRTWRADLVHAHDARAHAIALAALLGRRGVPLVVTRRVTFVPRGRMKYGPRVARFIAISEAVRESLELGGVPRDQIDVVYSGVPLPSVAHARDWRVECGWPADSVLCGVVGAMTSEKGIERLAEIARALPRDAARRARLVMLGGSSAGVDDVGGVTAYRAGFVDEIHAAMAGLDVLWHPATAEGLGTAVIDAMGLGVPPLAFAVGGLRELVVHKESGVLVPPGDIQAFALAAGNLIENDQLRGALGAAGPARASIFSVERMVDGTAAVYQKVLRSPHGVRPLETP